LPGSVNSNSASAAGAEVHDLTISAPLTFGRLPGGPLDDIEILRKVNFVNEKMGNRTHNLCALHQHTRGGRSSRHWYLLNFQPLLPVLKSVICFLALAPASQKGAQSACLEPAAGSLPME
jgi:hypothetical protein